MKQIGLDIGSTTIKCVVLEDGKIIYTDYKRHYSHIKDNLVEKLNYLLDNQIVDNDTPLAISGSAGMGLADGIGVTFVQEVYATRVAANKLIPGTDCIIELGGEDAKILFLTNGMEVRMNGSCAGGTGAFIDQMATLLNIDVTEINGIAKGHQKSILSPLVVASLLKLIYNLFLIKELLSQILQPQFSKPLLTKQLVV